MNEKDQEQIESNLSVCGLRYAGLRIRDAGNGNHMRNEDSLLMPAVDEREKELSGKAAYITWWIGLGAFTLVIYVYAMLSLYAGFDPTFLWWIAALMWVHGFSMPIVYLLLLKKES